MFYIATATAIVGPYSTLQAAHAAAVTNFTDESVRVVPAGHPAMLAADKVWLAPLPA